MNHNDYQDALYDLNGSDVMDADRRALVLAHLETCDDCSALEKRWSYVSKTYLGGLPMVRSAQASEQVVQNILARLPDVYSRVQDLQWPLFTRWALPLLGAAAAALLLAVKSPVSSDSEASDPYSMDSSNASVQSAQTPFSAESTGDL